MKLSNTKTVTVIQLLDLELDEGLEITVEPNFPVLLPMSFMAMNRLAVSFTTKEDVDETL